MVPVSAGSPVVVGVDGSPHAVAATRWAGEEARSQNRGECGGGLSWTGRPGR